MTIVHVELKGRPLEGAIILATPRNTLLEPQKTRTDGGGNGGFKTISSSYRIEVKHGLLPGGCIRLEREYPLNQEIRIQL